MAAHVSFVASALAGCGRVGVELLTAWHEPQEAGWTDEAGTGPGFDAGDGPALDAGDGVALDAAPNDAPGTGDDARPTQDANQPDRIPDDASDGAARSDDAGPSDAGPEPVGPRLSIDNSGTQALADYPVRFTIDTATPIAQGLLAADCSSLRVFGGANCAVEHAFFLPEHSCDSAATELWVRVPALAARGGEVLHLAFDDTRGAGSDGDAVFAFFDDFGGSALDRRRWQTFGSGSVAVAGGRLRNAGVVLLQSAGAELRAGADAFGVRIAAAGEPGTDVELGAGEFFSAADLNNIWAFRRSWQGASFLSYIQTIWAHTPSPGASCEGLSWPPAALGAPFVDEAPTTPSFLNAEFGYTIVAGRTDAWLRTSRGAAFELHSDQGCTLPAALPILIGLDHSTDGPLVEQQIDYVYVRPKASIEPTTSVLADSSLRCGSR